MKVGQERFGVKSHAKDSSGGFSCQFPSSQVFSIKSSTQHSSSTLSLLQLFRYNPNFCRGYQGFEPTNRYKSGLAHYDLFFSPASKYSLCTSILSLVFLCDKPNPVTNVDAKP